MYIHFVILDGWRYHRLNDNDIKKCHKIDSGCCCSGYMYILGYSENVKKGEITVNNYEYPYEIQSKLIEKY